MELEAVLAGAKTDHEQLGLLLQAVRSGLTLPADALVAGEPVQVVTVEYDGHPRRGLVATCRRGEERHEVGLADIQFGPGTDGARQTGSALGEGEVGRRRGARLRAARRRSAAAVGRDTVDAVCTQ